MKTWDNLKNELVLEDEEMELIRIEKELIGAIISAREEKHLSQLQVAKMSNLKQAGISRMESGKHSPRVDTLLRVLIPLGYTLQIVPKQDK